VTRPAEVRAAPAVAPTLLAAVRLLLADPDLPPSLDGLDRLDGLDGLGGSDGPGEGEGGARDLGRQRLGER
jgi:hypothetical protein